MAAKAVLWSFSGFGGNQGPLQGTILASKDWTHGKEAVESIQIRPGEPKARLGSGLCGFGSFLGVSENVFGGLTEVFSKQVRTSLLQSGERTHKKANGLTKCKTIITMVRDEEDVMAGNDFQL
ncbi:hypothetical protein BTVI_15605 [Pitangus sulphuratus]|nr:hypothetical protein BTVI_15605 [Pitangus sulphuratus]